MGKFNCVNQTKCELMPGHQFTIELKNLDESSFHPYIQDIDVMRFGIIDADLSAVCAYVSATLNVRFKRPLEITVHEKFLANKLGVNRYDKVNGIYTGKFAIDVDIAIMKPFNATELTVGKVFRAKGVPIQARKSMANIDATFTFNDNEVDFITLKKGSKDIYDLDVTLGGRGGSFIDPTIYTDFDFLMRYDGIIRRVN